MLARERNQDKHFSNGAGVDGATKYLRSRGLRLLIYDLVLNKMEPGFSCAERAELKRQGLKCGHS